MLEVIRADGLITIQDAGRTGWQRFGVPRSGPMDEFAFGAANLLCSNTLQTAGLEIGGGDAAFRATSDCVIAVAGAGYDLTINIWQYPLWGAYFVRSGWEIRLTKIGVGMWVYVAVAGGLGADTVLGSRSTYLRGRFGGLEGRRLEPGDVLRSEAPRHELMETAGRTFSKTLLPGYSDSPTVEAILGPQAEQLGQEDVDAFFSNAYQVSASSDRMGYRLEGAQLPHRAGAELISEGMTAGSIQVPADGAPIVMMADCPTTGGYPKLACVTRVDLPVLAQCIPGKSHVHFRKTTVEAAQEKYRAMIGALRIGIVEPE